MNAFDFFTAPVDWVEQGKAPEAVVAGVLPCNDDAMAQLGQVERKLCPYPQVARYTGGYGASATSFLCVRVEVDCYSRKSAKQD